MKNGSGGGYTLIELLIAMLMFAILAATAFPSLASMLAYRRASEGAQIMAMSLKQARARAIETSSVAAVTVSGRNVTTAVANGVRMPSTVQLPERVSVGGTNTFSFGPNGMALVAGSAAVASDSASKTVEVSQLGQVLVY